ncbi:unnamed protein product [Peniophora sp. CBMAI 1063]|nr:unnamed protein product [Peniophora sp. CBMAI 1063]
MQVAATENGPLFEHFNGSDPDVFPLFGDSTSNQALLYSPPMGDGVIFNDPTYPNYTLPSPETPFSNASPPPRNFSYTLLLSPTTAGLPSRPQTACALTRAVNPRTNGTLASQQLWLRDGSDGYRTEWLINGLTPSTNYTMYTVLNGAKVAGPQYFVTKSGTFSCPLVHSLPYCPSVSYAVPLAFPARAAGGVYTSTTLPSSITDPLMSYLSNFTTSLTSFACGRDYYSPLKSCADCRRAYQKWLCSVSFPRCGEYPSINTTGFALPTTVAPQDTAAQQTFRASIPTAALSAVPSGTTPRNANLPVFNQSYYSLLPCLETCAEADRSCPYFIGFKCPVIQFNANESYGIGYVDGYRDGHGSYEPGAGNPGVAQDVWGNVWCNQS